MTNKASKTKEVLYYHSDLVGTTSVVTNQTGDVVSTTDSQAFGVVRNTLSTRGDTDTYYGTHRKDVGSRIILTPERGYDPVINRFLSLDPAALYTAERFINDPLQMNLYSYSRNNPVTLNDPTGFSSECTSTICMLLGGFQQGYARNDRTSINLLQSTNQALQTVNTYVDYSTAGTYGSVTSAAYGTDVNGKPVSPAMRIVSAATLMIPEEKIATETAESIAFRTWLNIGEKDTYVYVAFKDGKDVYAGISKDPLSRFYQHLGAGKDFDSIQVLNPNNPLTRNQARSIEQAIISSNPQYLNAINSVSPKRDIFSQVIEFGNKFLKGTKK